MSRVRPKAFSAILILCVLLLYITGIKHFQFWEQITRLRDSDTASLISPEGIHPHALRFLLVFPIIKFAQLVGIKDDDMLTIFMWAIITLLAVFSSKLMQILANTKIPSWEKQFNLPYIAYTLIALLMNGRILFSFLGIVILVWSQTSWLTNRITSPLKLGMIQLISILLMAVSSGTMMVGLISLLIFDFWLPISRFPLIHRHNIRLLPLGILILLVTSVPIIVSINKNIDFFGGGAQGVENMLGHGWGGLAANLVLAIPGLAIILILSILPVGIFFFLKLNSLLKTVNPTSPLIIALFCSVSVGIFGFSTLLVGLPIAIILILMRISRSPISSEIRINPFGDTNSSALK